MRHTLQYLSVAAMLMLAAAPVGAAGSDSWRLVRKYCSNCHEVTPRPSGERLGADGAPSFAALAADPVKSSPEHLRALLGGRHSSMPPHKFSEADIYQVTQYFQNLRGQPAVQTESPP